MIHNELLSIYYIYTFFYWIFQSSPSAISVNDRNKEHRDRDGERDRERERERDRDRDRDRERERDREDRKNEQQQHRDKRNSKEVNNIQLIKHHTAHSYIHLCYSDSLNYPNQVFDYFDGACLPGGHQIILPSVEHTSIIWVFIYQN